MGKQIFNRIKKVLVILLAVLFVVSLTGVVAVTAPDHGHGHGHHHGHYHHGHWVDDYYGGYYEEPVVVGTPVVEAPVVVGGYGDGYEGDGYWDSYHHWHHHGHGHGHGHGHH